MNRKVFYVTPDIKEMELKSEGILCASERDGQIAPLNEKYDWDMWNNN